MHRKFLEHWRLPTTPWAIFGCGFVVLYLGQCSTGGVRVGRLLTITIQYPEVEIGMNGRALGSGRVQVHSLGRRIGHPLGGISAGDHQFHSFDGDGALGPLGGRRLSEIARLSSQAPSTREWWDRGRPPIHEYVFEFLKPTDVVHFRYAGHEAVLESLSMSQMLVDYVCELELDFKVQFPEVQRLAEELFMAAVQGRIGERELESAAWWGNLITFEMRERTARAQLHISPFDQATHDRLSDVRARWIALNAFLDELAKARYRLDRVPSPEMGERLWAELARARDASNPRSGYGGHPLPVDYLDGPLRALTLSEAALRPSILKRINADVPLACIVAGRTRDPSYYEACEGLYRRIENAVPKDLEPERQERKLAAAWALIALEPERAAVELLTSMQRFPDVSLVTLLGFTGNQEIEKYLRELAAKDDRGLMKSLPNAMRDPMYNRGELKCALAALELGLRIEEYWDLP